MTIGLEVHAQLRTPTKIFCACPSWGDLTEANQRTCPVCLGYPGELPVLQPGVVDLGARVVLGLSGEIQLRSGFDRKSYFYPDLPRGYQITQLQRPLGLGGSLKINSPEGDVREIEIERVHLEEDAGKLTHLGSGDHAVVDFNRAGVPLVEIVTRPVLRSPREARIFLEELRRVLLYLDACDGDMAQGSLRCDANLSLAPPGDPPGKRCEIKNLNSFRHLQRALEFESRRQREVLAAGGEVVQETRLWDEGKAETRPMRSKEGGADYRYQAEPDLPEIRLTESWVEAARRSLPELPRDRLQRLIETLGLPHYDAEILTRLPGRVNYFEQVVEHSGCSPKTCCNWITSELMGRLGEVPVEGSRVASDQLGKLISMVEAQELNRLQAKRVLDRMVQTGEEPEQIRVALGLRRMLPEASLEGLVEGVLRENPGCVCDYRKGKIQVLGFLVGQVLKVAKGAADPGLVKRLLQEVLE